MAQQEKNLLAMQETQDTWVWSLDWEDPLEEENGNSVQYSCLKNPMDRGAWWATVHGVAKSQTWLGKYACSVMCILWVWINVYDMYPSLEYYTEYFHCPENPLCCTLNTLSSPANPISNIYFLCLFTPWQFLYFWCWIIFHYLDILQLIHSLTDSHLSCFQVWGIINKISIDIWVLVQVFNSIG